MLSFQQVQSRIFGPARRPRGSSGTDLVPGLNQLALDPRSSPTQTIPTNHQHGSAEFRSEGRHSGKVRRIVSEQPVHDGHRPGRDRSKDGRLFGVGSGPRVRHGCSKIVPAEGQVERKRQKWRQNSNRKIAATEFG